MFAEVVIAGSYKNLSKATKGASKEMKGFGKTAKKISMGVKAAWAGGVAIALDMVWEGIKKLGKAAAEEAQSMTMLRHAMDKSWKATDQMGVQAEEFIKKMSYMSVIADDKLRPAYAKIVRVTKNASKAQNAFTKVLDISAATGKDVNVVSQAMAKYLAGNTKALDKIVPGIGKAANKWQYLKDKYGGAAKAMGDQKPFEKVQLVFNDIQERLGSYILPYVKQFADYLAGPEAQAKIEDFFAIIQNAFDYFQSAEGQKALKEYADGFIAIGDALIDIGKSLSESKWFWDIVSTGMKTSGLAIIGKVLENVTGKKSPATTSSNPAAQQQGIAINIYGTTSGDEVVKVLKKTAAQKGIPLSRLLG